MRKMLTLIMALGMTVVFSGATLVFADCAYHKTQAGVDKTDPAKQVATEPTTEKTEATKVQTAQADKSTQPVPADKK
jgi:hypothetical protein